MILPIVSHLVVSVLDLAILIGAKRCLTIGLIHISLMTHRVKHFFFHVFICHLCIFFGEVSVGVFGLFFYCFICFLILEFSELLLYLDKSPLSNMSFIFSPSI